MARFALAVGAVVLVTACGGSAKLGGGKEGAAQALAAASSPSMSPTVMSASGDTTYNCPHGGTVAVAFTTLDGQNLTFTGTYDGCSVDGKSSLTGTLTTEMSFTYDSTSMSFTQHMTGDLVISGDISDTLTADVTQTVNVTGTSTSGELSVVLDGSIETSTALYTYTNESFSLRLDGALPRG